MKSKFTPNARLPIGAKVIKPLRKNIGGYNELVYDAVLTWRSIRWYRIKDGWGQRETSFGGQRNNHPNEAWVADVSGIPVSLSDYEWRELGGLFRQKWKGFKAGLRGATADGLDKAKRVRAELAAKTAVNEVAIKRLTAATA